MYKLASLIIMLALAFPALGCDESCQRDRAAANFNVSFPSYLTWKFCDDTKMSFMQSDIPSLENYRHNRLDTQYKVRMKNIKSFVEQRKEWLSECDNYLRLTERGRIFKDEATTTKMFEAMDAITRELDRAINGVSYVASGNEDENAIIASKFDAFFKMADDHKALMMLKGQFVTN